MKTLLHGIAAASKNYSTCPQNFKVRAGLILLELYPYHPNNYTFPLLLPQEAGAI